ncbi:NAD(P)/FAD-dependent oxidoreductase [Spirosoma utsteinense]|uniref:Thioredoxin reductase n=1 Tax=Spirosoma utsteinense TaxID=2585773 RepID=A0ABR6W6D9_9BACT|nr:NAD(P)/FAD-dependent oxidoreductase [Spirosoma utsteinense]MBC3787926.1 thioredoxin reductase [Spirosoma utsteinense]MBC3792151.1 thioredoxin reductase [Spirosoma utsteinense]
MSVKQPYDTIIIGGSYAGLSAALTLGRSLRRVLVIDAGQPANRQTPHAHGFLTRDGATPAELSAIARQQVSQYPTVQFWSDKVVFAASVGNEFSVTTGNGVQFQARKLLLATGVFDIMPDLPGFAECWGRSVLHCPYCHGYEVHGEPMGVLANGEVGYEMAALIQHWASHLTLFTNGPSTLTATQEAILGQLNIPIVETPITAIEHQTGMLTSLLFGDGGRAHPKAVFSRVPFRLHTDIAIQLGCDVAENGLITATEFGETTVPGVFAAGDATTLFRQVAFAVSNGSKAGAWINRELISAELQQRTDFTPAQM